MNQLIYPTVTISRTTRPTSPDLCPAIISIPSYNGQQPLIYGRVQTPWKDLFIVFTTEGFICRCIFTDQPNDVVLKEQSAFLGTLLVEEDNNEAQNIIQKALTGNPASTILVRGTSFQIDVWRMLVRVPKGHVISYSQLAQWLGRPSAVRAVANAIAANPVGYIIPCHRIVHNNGSIGQFAWGSQLKAALIAYEQQA